MRATTAENTVKARPIARKDGPPLYISVVFVNAGRRRIMRRYPLPNDLISRPAQAQAGWAIERFVLELDAGYTRKHAAAHDGWMPDGWWHAALISAPFAIGQTIRALRRDEGLVYFLGRVATVSCVNAQEDVWHVVVEFPDGAGNEFTGTPAELHRWLYA